MKYENLEFGRVYHIYNRGNNHENLFYTEENYHYFLKLYDKYLSAIFDTYCYCLMPNHFHLLVRVKEENEIPEEVKLLMVSKKTSKVVGKTSKVFKTFEVSDLNKTSKVLETFEEC